MNVKQLIAELQKLPPHLEVVIWGGEEEDDWIEIKQALFEDGTSQVALLPYVEETVPA